MSLFDIKPTVVYSAFVQIRLQVTLLHLSYRIPDSIGKDIEKSCQSIYPLHDVFIRKVKVLKKPKLDSMYRII